MVVRTFESDARSIKGSHSCLCFVTNILHVIQVSGSHLVCTFRAPYFLLTLPNAFHLLVSISARFLVRLYQGKNIKIKRMHTLHYNKTKSKEFFGYSMAEIQRNLFHASCLKNRYAYSGMEKQR